MSAPAQAPTSPSTLSPSPPAALRAAREALVALIDSGLSPSDGRVATLAALLLSATAATAAAFPPPALPSTPPPPVPANKHNGFPTGLAPVGAHLPGAPDRAFHHQNARSIVTARLALEGAFDPPPHPSSQVKTALPHASENVSVFHAAASVIAERPPRRSSSKRTSPTTSPTLGARSPRSPRHSARTPDAPLETLRLAPHIPAATGFRARSQIDLYRRLLRGAPIPLELHVAARGTPTARRKPLSSLSAPTVVRGVPRADDIEAEDGNNKPVVLPPVNVFDVRRLPKWDTAKVVERDDVVMPGEKLTDDEVTERKMIAQAHHDRICALEVSAKEQHDIKVDDELRPRLDARMAQQRAALIASLKGEEEHERGNVLPNGAMANGMAFSPASGKLDRGNIVQREKSIEKTEVSVMRELAAAPISVVTNGDHAPSFEELLEEREKRVASRVQTRQRELIELGPMLSVKLKGKVLMEEKQLKLIELQRSLRGKVRNVMKRVLGRTGVSDLKLHTKGQFKRTKHAFAYGGAMGPGGRLLGQRGNVNHRIEQEARRKARRTHLMNGLLAHVEEFRTATHSRSVLHKRLLKDLEKYFRDRSREEERRKKKEQIERLRALRNNNEDEYLELLKTTKNKRLIQLLKQTDEYLVQIGAQVERQKQAAREDDEANGTVVSGAETGTSVDDNGDVDDNSATKDPDDELQQLKKRRNNYYTITHTISEKVHQPSILVGGTLKSYQIEGLEWLVSLYNNNLNGILADEMGLGKTIQTLSLITYLVDVKRINGPFLVIVPLSVMSNWVRELDLWAPSLTKVVYRGDPATRKNIQSYEMHGGNYNVLLTTYEFVVKDKNILGKIYWKYIIMDEGHRMKNADCKLALTLGAKYKSRNRLLLTGTPLQNNMTELWALLNFLLPSIFSSAETFETWFNAPFQASSLGDSAELNEEENLLIISRLHQVLRPFMLRRLKTDVESQLPDKVEIVFRCEMSVWQRVLYRQMRGKLGIAAGAGNVGFRSFNNMVMQLKKVCNHPFLFYQDEELMSIPRDYLMRASGKFELLEHCLRKLKRTGHRVLMFSQMTAALDYLEYFLSMIGMKHLRLDGTTKADDRQDMLEMFNAENSEYFCFLLSTRAGGLGLNLQTADTVIIFDSDWNPMMDLQAQDRAHRIGQTREVRVYRLICSGSIEVKILERANHKLQIDAQVIQAGQFNNKSSDKDRKEMLKDLLRQQGGDDLTNNVDVTSLSEINRQLARSDEELEIFEEMDAQADAERGGKPRLLIDEGELPSWVLQPEVEQEQKKQDDEINFLEHGRGRRKRKMVLYDDNLTEREWTAAMEEEGDVQGAIRRKRMRLSVQTSAAESYSGDENGIQRESEKESGAPDTVPRDSEAERPNSKAEDSAPDGADDDSRSDAQQSTSLSKLKPFVDPELHRDRKPRRKRGRPRKD